MYKNPRVGFGIGIMGVCLIAFILRIYHLTSLPVFVDEAIYVRWSQVMAHEATLRFLPLSDGKQPLFMWVLMFMIKPFHDPLFAGRLLSVLCGIGVTVGIIVLSWIVYKSKKVSLLSGLFWAVSPFSLFFDRLALVDSMLTLFGIWTVIFSILAAKSKRYDLAMLAGFSLGFASLTKSPSLFFAVLLPACFLLYGPVKKDIFRIAAIYLIAFVMYNVLRLGPNFHLLNIRNYDYVYPYSHILTSPLDPLKGHMGGIWSYFIKLAPIGLGLLAVLGVVVGFQRRRRQILLLISFGILPIFVIAEFSKVVTARYILFVLPFFCVLAGSAFLSKKELIKKIFAVLLILFLAQSLFIDYYLLSNVEAAPLPQGERNGYLEEWTAGQGILEIANFVKAQLANNPGRKIVVGTEGYFGTLPDGLQMYVQGIDNIVVVGVGLGFQKLPDSLESSRISGNKTYLVINKSRLNLDPDKNGLKLIASYKKASRTPGSIEYQRYGPQEELLFFEVTK